MTSKSLLALIEGNGPTSYYHAFQARKHLDDFRHLALSDEVVILAEGRAVERLTDLPIPSRLVQGLFSGSIGFNFERVTYTKGVPPFEMSVVKALRKAETLP